MTARSFEFASKNTASLDVGCVVVVTPPEVVTHALVSSLKLLLPEVDLNLFAIP